jgi:hypothetical protein
MNRDLNLGNSLSLDRCPHCAVHKPLLHRQYELQTTDDRGKDLRKWAIYLCTRCGGVVTASGTPTNGFVTNIFPSTIAVEDSIPERPREFLKQAIETLFAPAGSLMLSASAVDAMLKEKGYLDGSLSIRIKQAVDDNLLTKEMASWAHKIRLDANDQRHSDYSASLPTVDDAQNCVSFAIALGEFLFVLPSKIAEGIKHIDDRSDQPRVAGGAGSGPEVE